MGIDRSRRTSFELVADLYNETRPGYPDELAEDIIRLSALPPDGQVLEVGCGAGNATLPFAQRGYRLLGIELGERLAQYARQRCAAFPKAVIVQSAFEDYELTPHSFDLAISAEAFHWVRPEIGYPKLMNALKETGSIVLFWQVAVDPQTDWSRAIDDIFRRRAPQFESPHHSFSLEWLVNLMRGNLREYCGLEEVTVKTYDCSETLSAEAFVKLMRTNSSLRGMDDEVREAIHAEVRAVINGFGDSVDNPYQVALFHAKVKRDG